MRKNLLLIAFALQALHVFAQVAVSKEPRHHNVFENSFVRVLDVHIAPGDTTQFHKHATPSIFIVLHPVKTGSEVTMEETKATALLKDASISFEGFYVKPRIHRVWNEDTSEFHVMDVEILHKKPLLSIEPIKEKTFELLFDEKPVRAYKLVLQSGKNVELKRQAPLLVVALSNSDKDVSANDKALNKKGEFVFIPADKPFHFMNNDHQNFSFAVIEFK